MMRHTRGAMVETLGADYVRTTRAKSVAERMGVLKHAPRHALIPGVTPGALQVRRRLLRRPAAALALAMMSAFILIALSAPWLAPFDPIATDFGAVRKTPSALHRLGTDEVGRDVLARLIWGARASLLAGLIPITIT